MPLAVQNQPCSMYFVNPTSQTAGQAQSAAATLGANLVVMNDAAENANVAAALDASPYSGQTIWIGYQRTGAGASTFYASDGTTGPFTPSNSNPNIYQNWAGGEPNNNGYGDTDWLGNCDWDCTNGEQCVQIYPGGQWNDLGCNDNSISVIEVNLCPEITVDVSANNFCAGNSSTLTASTLLGSQPYQYMWSTNQPTAAITVSPPTTTTYTVGVADRYQCSAADSVEIVVLQGPDATFTMDASACIGEPVNVTYTGNASAGATYTWNFGTGVIVAGSGQGPYQVAWPTSGNQNATLEVTENGCTSPTGTQSVTISPSPTADFTFTTVCVGSATDLTNTSNGNGAVIVGSAWIVEGDTIVSTDLSHTFSAAGTFPVTLGVLTLDSCYATVTQQVTVNPGPTATVSTTDVSCYGDCDGEAEAVIQGGAAPVTVLWDNNATGTTVQGLCAGPVSATVTDANGCSFTAQDTIGQPDSLVVTVAVVETTCPGLSTGTATETVTGGTPPYTTDWGGEDPNALAAGSYTVTVTDANGCITTEQFAIADGPGLTFTFTITDNICFGGDDGQAILVVSDGVAPYDIVWTDAFLNPLQTDLQTQGSATLSNLSAGTYNVGAQDATGCQNAATISITQPAQDLVMTLTPTDLTCFESGDGQIAATQGGLSPYQFALSDVNGDPIEAATDPTSYTFQDLDIGIYFVDITDANGCTTTDAVELTQPDDLTAESTVTPISCYLGSDGAISYTLISGGTTPYQPVTWNDPNAQTGNTATGLSQGTYTATITDANGCELQETFSLTHPQKLTLEGRYYTDTCGQSKGAAIIDVSLGTSPYSYLWKPDSITTAIHYNLPADSFEVVVTDANGCMDSVYVQVQDDLPYPTAAFDYRFEGENLIDQEVLFINNSDGTISWSWFFGDNAFSNSENPRHHYERAGDYLVQLLASNGYCADTAYKYVNIDPLMLLYVPNAFTPGINGKNDYFYPQGEGIEEESYDMFIYDRWGKLVWQTGNFSKKWDGKNLNGKEVPVGTYVWIIKFREYADLDRHVYKGIVTLIRD